MSFARAWLLVALALVPLWWWLRAGRLNRLRGASLSDVRPARGPIERLWISRLPVAFRSLCFGAWVVAAAGPRIGGGASRYRARLTGSQPALIINRRIG